MSMHCLDLARSARLVQEMAEAMSVDLDQEVAAHRVDMNEVAHAMMRCTECPGANSCDAVREAEGAVNPPKCCKNFMFFQGLVAKETGKVLTAVY